MAPFIFAEGIALSEDELRVITDLSTTRELATDPSNQVADDPLAVRMGRDFFFDPRLSGNNAVSCATCHQPSQGWGDGESTPARFPSIIRNTQSLWDVGYHSRFFWDGRAPSLWEQALSPIEGEAEMDGHRLKIALLVHQDVHLRSDYETLFGAFSKSLDAELTRIAAETGTLRSCADWDAVYRNVDSSVASQIDQIIGNVAKTLSAFQRRLVSGTARFDLFARKARINTIPEDILTASELRGLKLFTKMSCIKCHNGPTFSDGMLHRVRTQASGAEFMFVMTPSLRNVALTGPYMHDGQVDSLLSAVSDCHPGQTSNIPRSEREDLAAFLRTLTDTAIGPRDPGGLYAVEIYLRSKE